MTDEKKKLGLSVNPTQKLNINIGAKNTVATPGQRGVHNKVVVVTKNRIQGASTHAAKSGSGGGLTEKEQEQRLMVLKQAEIERKIQAQKSIERQGLQNSTSNGGLDFDGDVNGINRADDPSDIIKDSAQVQSGTPDAEDSEADKRNKKKPEFVKAHDSEEREITINRKKSQGKRENQKLSVSALSSTDEGEDIIEGGRKSRSIASIRRAQEKAMRKSREGMLGAQKEKKSREVLLPDLISVQELASRMAEKGTDVMKALIKMGVMVTINQSIDADTAEILVSEFGHIVKRVSDEEVEKILINEQQDAPSQMRSRSPVVTVMGHVDHGKTSLLDALRSTDVAAGEAGGITQHIGSYKVQLANGKSITFLDTPGHEAFTAMRSRGAKVTDIVILVVAADDGIMAQTIEAINHAKAAAVPIIVAINKIDRPDSNPQKVKNELLIHNLVPDDLGGDVMVVEVSAREKINLEKLEEVILLQAEMLDLKANPDRAASGVVIESKMEKGRGAVATLIVNRGTLRPGDLVIAGTSFGKVRGLLNDKGANIQSAGPATPVEIIGLDSVPTAGDSFMVAPSDKVAREIVELRLNRDRQKRLVSAARMSLEQMFTIASQSGYKELNLIVKADVQGSVEAIVTNLNKLSTEEIAVKIRHFGVGGINESDVTLATTCKGIILAFNVRPNAQARELARASKIDIRYYSIIYKLIDEVKAAMSGMLSPHIREEYLGIAEVRKVFDVSKVGKIAGCQVTDGLIKRHCNCRVIRDNIVIYDGKLKMLKRFKDDVKEVKNGFECGISFEKYDDIKEMDRIECYELKEEARTI